MVRANFLLVSLHENHEQEKRSLPEGISESTDDKRHDQKRWNFVGCLLFFSSFVLSGLVIGVLS